MRLVYKATGAEVKVGDEVTSFRGEKGVVESIEKPRHGGSTGRVYVKEEKWSHGYYPSVYDMEWLDREDQR